MLDDAKVTAELGCRLRATGLPLDHLGLYLRTLHPEIRGRTIAWAPDEPVQIHDRQHGVELSAAHLNNPNPACVGDAGTDCFVGQPFE
jgi:adenylate cyclase